MPSKTEEYLALAQRTANGLTRYWESWTDQEESRLPGLPQGTERDARTGSGTEKRRTIFCGRKNSTGERADSIRTKYRELTVSGQLPVFFMFYYPIGNNAVY